MSTQEETSTVKISDLTPYKNRFNVSFKVISGSEERTVNNRNNPDESHRVKDLIVGDETAQIVLSAWDDEIDTLEVGKYFVLENGYVNVFRDSMRLARGKFGQFSTSDVSFEPNTAVNRSEEVQEARPRRQRSYGDFDRSNRGDFGSSQRSRRSDQPDRSSRW